MPWTEKDVEKHNKGLTTKQKKQWVDVANSHLSKCTGDGGDEKTCAAEAIKMANGVVKKDMSNNVLENYSSAAVAYAIRTEMLDGKKYLAVPVVMMVEGVHSGSHGPLLHLAEDLGKFPASWDGIPVMIGHPSIDGNNVSANIPQILENAVGRVFNTHMENEKLKAEVWLDEQKLIAISPEVLSYIQSGKPLDVSLGVFTEEESTTGIYTNSNGDQETYNAIARNHRPDHLALLPGESGACGWSDGCGIRSNSSINVIKEGVMKNEQILVMRQAAVDALLQSITDNKQGFQELISKIAELLYAQDSQEEYYMLEEVYTDSVVYRKRCQDNTDDSGYYQQSYAINADGSVALTGDPQRVNRNLAYVPVTMKRTIFNSNKGGPKMTENKPCCLEKVTELLGNPQLNLNETEDKDWLLGLGAERLARLTPKAPEVIEVNKEVRVEVPVATDLTDYVRKDSFKTAEDVLAVVPEEMKESFTTGIKLHQAHHVELVKEILINSAEGAWTEDELNLHNTAMLEKLSKQFKPQVNYAGQGAGAGLKPNATVASEEKLLPIV